MIVDHDQDGELSVTYIWINERVPPEFERRLLNELLALSEPVGLGAIEAHGRKGEALNAILDEGLREAAHDHRGRRRQDDAFHFDYVCGYRIKVDYLPFGISIYEDSPELHLRYPGMPVVVSSMFDREYGKGALEGAVRLALSQGTGSRGAN
ncbi:hypothetical protein FY036_00960 [Mesorhizobium microcysteis]|uniref:Uncharacterized protein n=1 Tax=Neoaquamicrobium microcysteis TaxID=2682781 RepID=A0A5D4H842_9HYPH|nr:hypothetical protein [Mesorhizobium microcysteis]TYR36423.1 hypothetical protein FY036_00960 [Mesorhizobium microcysteis]